MVAYNKIVFMSTKVFILGRPGGGKSTAARFIKDKVKDRGLVIDHLYDYSILYEMFHEDTQGRFQAKPNGNFDIIDPSVYHEALEKLEKVAEQTCAQFIIIEFARDDYKEALEHFSPDFLRNAFFLYLDASVETCLDRAHKRASLLNPNRHPIRPDEAYRDYYGKDIGQYMRYQFAKDLQVGNRFKFISNEGSLDVLQEQIDEFVRKRLFLPFEGQENGLPHFRRRLKEK
jgi:adenylate kinase family enzyme